MLESESVAPNTLFQKTEPILFSLSISPLLEKEDLINNANDSYLINKSKEIAMQRLKFQMQKVEKWLTNSGLKVNVEKT
jgi:hypothetical protein